MGGEIRLENSMMHKGLETGGGGGGDYTDWGSLYGRLIPG